MIDFGQRPCHRPLRILHCCRHCPPQVGTRALQPSALPLPLCQLRSPISRRGSGHPLHSQELSKLLFEKRVPFWACARHFGVALRERSDIGVETYCSRRAGTRASFCSNSARPCSLCRTPECMGAPSPAFERLSAAAPLSRPALRGPGLANRVVPQLGCDPHFGPRRSPRFLAPAHVPCPLFSLAPGGTPLGERFLATGCRKARVLDCAREKPPCGR